MLLQNEQNIANSFILSTLSSKSLITEFSNILESNNSNSLRIFLEEHQEKDKVSELKNILYNNSGELIQEKFDDFKRHVSERLNFQERNQVFLQESTAYLDSDSSPYGSRDVDSQDFSNASNYHDPREIELRNRDESGRVIKEISKVVIRGDVFTYARAMMGGLDFDTVSDVNGQSFILITGQTALKRPTGVRGNIPKIAGNHVIPLSEYIDQIDAAIKEKPVLEAVRNLSEKLAGSEIVDQNQTFPQSIIDRARSFYEFETPSFEQQFAAFRFLSREMIPTMTALHNQSIAAAFKGERTTNELLEEARNVGKFLGNNKENLDSNLEEFVSVVDYSPITNPSKKSSEVNIKNGDRDNKLDSLCYVMGDVVSYYLCSRGVDAADSLEITEKLVQETIDKKGWVQHYENHQEELNPEINMSDLEKSLKHYVVKQIKKRLPIFYVDSEQLSDTISSKSESRSSQDHSSLQINEKLINSSSTQDNQYVSHLISRSSYAMNDESDQRQVTQGESTTAGQKRKLDDSSGQVAENQPKRITETAAVLEH